MWRSMMLIVVAAPTWAHAGSDSLLALGFGAGVGAQRSDDGGATTVELKARLRALRGLGAELAYDPVDDDADPVLGAPFRLSLLLYVVPTSPVGAFLKGGIGSS